MNLDTLFDDDSYTSGITAAVPGMAPIAPAAKVAAKASEPVMPGSSPPQTWRQVAMAAIGQSDKSRQAELRRLYDNTARDYLCFGDPDYADQIALNYLNERLRDGLGRQITITEFTVDGAGGFLVARWHLDTVQPAEKAAPPMPDIIPHKVMRQSDGLLPGMGRAI